MHTPKFAILVPLLAGVAACSSPSEAPVANDATEVVLPETEEANVAVTNTPAAAAHAHAAWAGKWIGVEGMFVTITPTDPGKYKLQMVATLDDPAQGVSYEGSDAEGGIAFTRAGKAELLRASNGDQTGLKWLAGKKDCLMVQESEGFCRD